MHLYFNILTESPSIVGHSYGQHNSQAGHFDILGSYLPCAEKENHGDRKHQRKRKQVKFIIFNTPSLSIVRKHVLSNLQQLEETIILNRITEEERELLNIKEVSARQSVKIAIENEEERRRKVSAGIVDDGENKEELQNGFFELSD